MAKRTVEEILEETLEALAEAAGKLEDAAGGIEALWVREAWGEEGSPTGAIAGVRSMVERLRRWVEHLKEGRSG